VIKIPANWKCPHCSEMLPEPGKWFRFKEGLTEYLQDKGVIFWTISFTVFLFIVGVGDMLFGYSRLLTYIAQNLLFSIGALFFGGMIISMYMKIVIPLRLPYGGGSFILRERVVIRNIRKGTNIAAVLGLSACLFWAGPWMFINYFPSYLIILSWFFALAWSISGLFINPKWLEDVRFRFFLDERLGVTSLKRYRKLSTIFIAVLVITVIGYYVLLQIPGLWNKIENGTILGSMIVQFKNYFSWLI